MDLKFLNITPPWEWPDDTAECFIAALQNKRTDTADRQIAADLAGDITVMRDELAGALLTVVGDRSEPEEMRAAAAISFGPALETADIEGFDDDMSDSPISEEMFENIQTTLRRIFEDESEPKEVRRRSLEASVRAPLDWHGDAILKAWSSGDEEWKLTAVFSMRWISGEFENQIMESLGSPNPEIHMEAVRAAGAREVDAAWPRITAILSSRKTEKELLIAAITAAAEIRPQEAPEVLDRFMDEEDEDIAEAAGEAMMLTHAGDDEEGEDEEEGAGGYIN